MINVTGFDRVAESENFDYISDGHLKVGVEVSKNGDIKASIRRNYTMPVRCSYESSLAQEKAIERWQLHLNKLGVYLN